MDQPKIERIAMLLGMTAEIMGTQLNEMSLAMMAGDLSAYSFEDVDKALTRCRREVKGRLTLAEIIERIDSSDSMPGPDEAWALMSKSEDETFAFSEQMGDAMRIAKPLMDSGDTIAARMAFKDAYTRIVREARENKVKPRWILSLGHDKEGRADAIAEAVKAGKLQLDHSISLLGPDAKAKVLQLTGQVNHPFLLEYKQAEKEEAAPIDVQTGQRRIAELKAMLAKKSQKAMA